MCAPMGAAAAGRSRTRRYSELFFDLAPGAHARLVQNEGADRLPRWALRGFSEAHRLLRLRHMCCSKYWQMETPPNESSRSGLTGSLIGILAPLVILYWGLIFIAGSSPWPFLKAFIGQRASQPR